MQYEWPVDNMFRGIVADSEDAISVIFRRVQIQGRAERLWDRGEPGVELVMQLVAYVADRIDVAGKEIAWGAEAGGGERRGGWAARI